MWSSEWKESSEWQSSEWSGCCCSHSSLWANNWSILLNSQAYAHCTVNALYTWIVVFSTCCFNQAFGKHHLNIDPCHYLIYCQKKNSDCFLCLNHWVMRPGIMTTLDLMVAIRLDIPFLPPSRHDACYLNHKSSVSPGNGKQWWSRLKYKQVRLPWLPNEGTHTRTLNMDVGAHADAFAQ